MLPIDTILKATQMEARIDRRHARLHPYRPQNDAQGANSRNRTAASAASRDVSGLR
jgi:hypothetical protein